MGELILAGLDILADLVHSGIEAAVTVGGGSLDIKCSVIEEHHALTLLKRDICGMGTENSQGLAVLVKVIGCRENHKLYAVCVAEKVLAGGNIYADSVGADFIYAVFAAHLFNGGSDDELAVLDFKRVAGLHSDKQSERKNIELDYLIFAKMLAVRQDYAAIFAVGFNIVFACREVFAAGVFARFFHSSFLTAGVVVLTLPGFFVLSVTFFMASGVDSFFSGSVVPSVEGSVLSSVMASTAAPLSEGEVESSLFFFDLQPQKSSIVTHRMSATAEISFLFIVFSLSF